MTSVEPMNDLSTYPEKMMESEKDNKAQKKEFRRFLFYTIFGSILVVLVSSFIILVQDPSVHR